MNITKWINVLLGRDRKDDIMTDEDNSDSNPLSFTSDEDPAFSSQNSISTTLNFNHSPASFAGANFGVQNNYHIYQSSTDKATASHNMLIDPSIEAKLGDVLTLEQEWRLEEALFAYKQLLEDGANSSSRLSQEQIEKIYTHMLLIYSKQHDIDNGRCIYEKYIRLGYSSSSQFLYAAFTHFFNEGSYEKAQQVIDEAMQLYPSEFRFKAYSVMNKLLWEDSPHKDIDADAEGYLLREFEICKPSEDGAIPNEIYLVEAQMLIKYCAGEYCKVIDIYNDMTCRKTILIHTCYVKSWFFDARRIVKQNGEYIERGYIDYVKINQLYAEIINIESRFCDAEKAIFRYAIADVYCNCLILLDKTEVIVSENLFSNISNDDAKRSIMTSMMLHGIPVESGLSDEMVVKIQSCLATDNHSGIIDLLWPWICNQPRIDTYFKASVLMAALNAKDHKRFVEILSWLKENSAYVDECIIPEAIYLYDMKATQKSISLLQSAFMRSQDPHFLINVVSVCTQLGEHSFAYDLTKMITRDKPFVIEICSDSFFALTYQIYVKLEKNQELEELILVMEQYKYQGKEYLLAQLTLSFHTNNCKLRIVFAEKLYELTGDSHYLFISAETRLAIFDMPGAQLCLDKLKACRNKNKADYLILSSRYYILASNNDMAQQCAKEAKDIEIDHPTSQAHAFYISTSLRTGHIEEASYMCEYASLYPSDRHKTWYRTLNAVTENESGETELTKEAIEFFEKAENYGQQVLMDYQNSQVGIAATKNRINWRYCHTMVSLPRLKVFSGDNKTLAHEYTNNHMKVVLDPFFFYWLEKLNMLHLLHNVDVVAIPYSVVQALVIDLLQEEDSAIRNILDFIREAVNVSFVSIDLKQKKSFAISENGISSELPDVVALVDCSLYAAASGNTYLYGDDNGRLISGFAGGQASSITAFVRHALEKKWITPEQYGQTFLKMTSLKFYFLNIDPLSVVNAFQSVDFNVCKEFNSLIEIKIGSDVISYIPVYFGFLLAMRDNGSFKKALNAVMCAFDTRYGRTQYHIHIATEYEDAKPYIEIRIACVWGIATALSLVVNEWSESDLLLAISTTCNHVSEANYKYIIKKAKVMYDVMVAHSVPM